MNRKTLLTSASDEEPNILRAVLTTGLAILILGALLWGLHCGRPLYAESGILYVDGASGQDTDTCGTLNQPCKTISHTVNALASSSDTIRVAQGVYTENLFISKTVRLEGGYEATSWTRDIEQYKTIIDGSNSRPVWGEWDEKWARYPTVITDSGEYKMWYVGYDRNEVGRIGYATSPDGVNWTKHAGNPVLDVGSGSAWDSQSLEAPFVIKEDGIYKMWYGAQSSDDTWRIGYATSPDGINWTKHATNPLIEAGSEDWNNRAVDNPYVLQEDGTYKMWLQTLGDDGSGWTPYIAYATSSDGLDWTWEETNPLLNPTNDWEEWIWKPNVLHVGSEYQMWYSAWGNDEGHTGYATATNETDWTKYDDPVLSGTPGAWDEGVAYDPSVLYANGVYTMWYDEGASIGVATSTNGIDWTKYDDLVLSYGTETEWSLPVMLFIPSADGSVLDGFTVRNGYSHSGGGIYARAQVTIQNCTVMSNTAHYGGGGIAVEWDSADVIISNTQVLSNSAGSYGGGIEVNLDAVANIVNSEIISNTATEEGGGGISIHARALVTDSRILSNTLTQGWASAGILVSDDALATLHSNEIAWNKGFGNSGPSGGIRLNGNAVVTAVKNHIHHNVVNDGDGGAISADGSTLRAYSNTMTHNQARSGGALRFGNNVNAILDSNVIAENDVSGSGGGASIYNSMVTFTNNVIAFNSGDDDWNGDGLFIRDTDSDVRIVNNTIVSNTSDGIDASDGAVVLVRNNIIAGNLRGITNYEEGATISADHNVLWENGWNDYNPGPGDVEADPLFVDAANGDFHLQMDSPCIDAGNPTGAPALDIEGKPRDAAPDIGAYEWGQYLIFLPITVRNLSPQESLQADFTASPTSGTAPLTVTFTNTSSGTYTSNLWHFGDGATSTLENPTHVYTTARAYTVALTVSGADDTDTITRANYIIVNTPSTGVRYVAPGGTDTDNDCSNSAEPCATMQHAVDVSAPGDEIRVAGGTYTDLNVRPRNDITTTSVVTQVAYVSKTVSIRGGYSTSDWSTPDPDANPTTLDAQRQGRGLYITGDITATLENLRITGGDATGLGGRQTWDGIVDTGGGVYAFNATLSISNSRLVSNTAWTGGGGYIAGSAHLDDNVIMDNFANGIGYENGGAGLFLEGGVTLTNNTITGNKSRANGGGLMTGYAQATLTGNTISGNVAGYTSGSSRMSEALAPLMPTACGGGAYLGTATLTNNTFSGNTATERGGGVMVFYGDVVMMEDNLFADNTTEGRGGGVYVIHSGPVEMMSNEITGNAADWFGGGVAIARYVSGETLLANNVMLNNQTDGYGSGLYVEGPAKLFHTTAASNTGGDGSSLSIAGDVALTNTILVSHSIGIQATDGSTLTVNGILWHNTPVTVSRATTTTVAFQNQHTGDPVFAADGYHLMVDSAAIDSGIETDVASDIDGDSRPQGAAFDLGADEYVTVRR